MIYTILNELPSRFPNVPAGVTYDGDNFFANISANDPQGECIEYSLISGTLPYGAILDPLSGNISGILKLRDVANTTTYCHDYSWTFTIRATNNLDYSDQDFTIVVKHVNVPPLWVNAVVNSSEVIELVDENINILGEYASNTDITIKLNAIYYQCAPLTFSLVTGDIPLGLSLSDDGIISGKLAKIPRGTSQHYYFTLNADDGIIMSTQAFNFTTTSLNIAPIWGTNTFDLVYPAGEPINYTANAIQLEGYPLTYSIANGTLPNGITLSPSGLNAGLIYGTSDVVPINTKYIFTIRADDGVSHADHLFSITLYRIYWFSPDENRGQQIGGTDYDFTAIVRTSRLSGQTTYSLIDGSLPAGTSLNSTAGTITGKLTNASSNYTFTIRATNSGISADRTFTGSVLGITTVKWISPTIQIAPWVGGTLYRYNPMDNPDLLIENAVGPTRYSIISGAVPLGTSFNEYTGQIIGTLNNSVYSYNFTMRATNNGISADCTFSGTVTRSTAISWISPASDLGQLKGGSSFSLISNVYVSNPSGPTIFSLANGALPNGTGISLNTNTGIIGGTLNNPATTSPSLTTPPETTNVLFTIRATNNELAADRIFNGTVVAQYPPVWQTVANSSIGDYPEGQPLTFRFVATDRNNDNLTYSLAPDSLPLPNGLTLNSNTGILSGTPINIVNQTNQSNLSWIIVGIPLGNGHYDGRDIRVTASAKDNGYTIQENGYEIVQTKPYDSPFIATNSTFMPTIGIPYTVTYKIIKTVKETNGITSYIRPAFDAEDPNGLLASAQGTKTGYGYNSTIDMIDTTNWVIGQPYDISVTWTPSIQYVYARGRIRINRSYPDDNFGTYPYSNAVFKILNQDVKYFETDVTYKFTLNVTDNIFPLVPRSFSIKIKGATTVTWVSPPEGAQSPILGNSTYLLISNVSVKNPVGTTVYSLQSGTLPAGTALNPNTGVITGTVPNVSSSYNFKIRAINNGISADRSFSGVIGAATVVTWNSPTAGALPASKGGTAYSFIPIVSVANPVGSTIYSIVLGSIPAGTNLNSATGVISGTLTNATSSYSFTMRATNNGVSAERPFSGTVSIQYAPEWISPAAGKIGEFIANQPINNGNGIQCSASDRNNDPLTYSLALGSTLPSGLTLSSSGLISGTPVNAVDQSALTGWYLIGPPYPYGHWDGALANVITSVTNLSPFPIPMGAPAGYVAPNYTVYRDTLTNKVVFRSKEMYDYGPIYNAVRSGDAPFITSDNTFVPKVGSTYKIVYSVKKIKAETNGIKSYLKPAFDAIYANGTVLADGTTVANETLNPALGTRSGFGYSNATDSVDTSSWIVGQSYDVVATWYVPPRTGFNNQDIQYSSARGRIRVNRSEPDSRLGTNAYSNAVFDITCQDIVYVNPRIDYNFYINVSDGILPPVPRLFSITIY